MASSPLRLAVIGVGHLGAIHTKLWKQYQDTSAELPTSPSIELAGIFDDDTARAQSVAQEHGVKRVFASFDDALASADAVCIVTPTSTHYALASRALRAGKHCFIEKPITSTHAEAQDLVRLAAETQRVVHVGHVERFNPALEAVRNRFGAAPAFESALASAPHSSPNAAPTLTPTLAPRFIEAHRLAQFKPRATDVSVILDLMIHDIDIVLQLVQSPVVQVDANGVAILTDTPDIANARIRFANGCVANLTASRITQKPMRKMRVFQGDAYISMDFATGDVEIFRLIDAEDSDGSTPEASIDGASAPSMSSSIPAMMLGNIEAGTRADGKKRAIIFEKPHNVVVNAIAREQELFVQAIAAQAAPQHEHSTRSTQSAATDAAQAAAALALAEEIARQIQQ
jgi:predicted dehydrogenase